MFSWHDKSSTVFLSLETYGVGRVFGVAVGNCGHTFRSFRSCVILLCDCVTENSATSRTFRLTSRALGPEALVRLGQTFACGLQG